MKFAIKAGIIFFILILSIVVLSKIDFPSPNKKIEVIWDHNLEEIKGEDTNKAVKSIIIKSTKKETKREIRLDGVFIAIGYLPYEGAEYAFTINGSENLLSKLEFKKNVNGLHLSFNVKDDLTNL